MDQIAESIGDFALYLHSERKAAGTIRSYCMGARKLYRYVISRGITSWDGVTRAMVRSWLESMSALSSTPTSRACTPAPGPSSATWKKRSGKAPADARR